MSLSDLAPPSASLIDNGNGTAYYEYHPYGANTPVVRRGPMPRRMARDWVMFLNGAEFPNQGETAPEVRRAGHGFDDHF
jgi:hypothetical protein